MRVDMADSRSGQESSSARDIRITSEVKGFDFVCLSIRADEYVSRPFVIELELLIADFDLEMKNFLGKHMTVELDVKDGLIRYFDGIITQFSYLTAVRGAACYKATLRPWLWLLTRNIQSKVHYVQPDQAVSATGTADQNTAGTAPNIIKNLFSNAGFSDVEFKLSRSYRVRDFCVQYQESDFAFVSRLMEQEGIYYYFKHESGKHTLVLADSSTAHAPFDNSLTNISYTNQEHSGQRADYIHEWSVSLEIQSGKLTIRDYDFTGPNANLDKVKSMAQGHASDSYEIYEYPGKYTKPADGEAYAGVHLEAEVARFERGAGTSNARWLAPGYLFTLADAARSDQNRQYLVLEAHSTIHAEFRGEDRQPFRTSFVALPNTYAYRPPRLTPRPFIRGPQTAVVVGPSGQEIYTDKYGRVKVQFLWDRIGTKDENSSCWIRCAQAWAGKSWGWVFIPRINQEVIVHFAEGDPDRPIITGAVYNGPEDQPSPITLPDNATQSTVKSNSSLGGNGFNQIMFEDKAGSENFYMHAQKDMNIEVLNNRTTTITQDDTETVKQGNRSLTVSQGNETKEISQGNQSLKVAQGNQTIEVTQGNRTITVGQGNEEVDINAGGHTMKVAQNYQLTISQGNYTVSISSGSASLTAAQGITISSDESITLSVGSNSISIGTSGITISGMNVSVSADIEAKLAGSATATIQGGIVNIN